MIILKTPWCAGNKNGENSCGLCYNGNKDWE